MIVLIFLSLPHCALEIFATGKLVDHGGEYGMEMPVNFHFYEPKKAIKLAKKRSNKNRRKLKRNRKTSCEVKCIQISDNRCIRWSVIGCIHYAEVSSRR